MIYKISRWIGLTVFSLLILIPSAIVVLGTFKTDLEIYDSPMALPLNWTLDNYRRLLDDGEILTNFKNSIFTLARRSSGDCQFLDAKERHCTVYENRPNTCRTHPQIGPKPGYCPYGALDQSRSK